MGTYVVGDIHGYFDEWMSLKEEIECEDTQARFILVGDIIDRGPKSMEMIRWAMENIQQDGQYQMVLGNHENWKINWWQEFKDMRIEYPNMTIQEYSEYHEEPYQFDKLIIDNNLSIEQVDEIIHFFEMLPVAIDIFIEIGRKRRQYLIVHSCMRREFLTEEGLFDKNLLALDEGDKVKREILLRRNYHGNIWEHRTVLVHGHTPTNCLELMARGAKVGQIDYREKDINVDCGIIAQRSRGNLAAIRLEDLKEFYYINY